MLDAAGNLERETRETWETCQPMAVQRTVQMLSPFIILPRATAAERFPKFPRFPTQIGDPARYIEAQKHIGAVEIVRRIS